MIETTLPNTANTSVYKLYRVILISSALVLGIDLVFYIIHLNKRASLNNMEEITFSQETEFSEYQKAVVLAVKESHVVPATINDQYLQIQKNHKKIIEFTTSQTSDPSVQVIGQRLDEKFIKYRGIANLVMTRNKESFANSKLFSSQLNNSAVSYIEVVNRLQRWVLKKDDSQNDFIITLLLISLGVILLLFIWSYKAVVDPIMNEKTSLDDTISFLKHQLKNTSAETKKAIESESEIIIQLKSKTAQIRKMQSSLELALIQTSNAKENIQLVNYKFASALTKTLNPIVLQKEILDNQVQFLKDENWNILSNSISKLYALSGYYYSESMEANIVQKRKAVYLNQLLVEVLVSINQSSNSMMMKIGDLPKVKTNESLLKLILQPYLEIMLIPVPSAPIDVAVIEQNKSSVFVFKGVSKSFAKSYSNIASSKKGNYSVDEFKIYMSNKLLAQHGSSHELITEGNIAIFKLTWLN